MRDRHVAGVTEIMRPPGSAKPGDARTVLAIIGVLLIPACITLASVRHPAGRGPAAGEASPLGYTWSLSFALVPVVAILAAAGARRRAGRHWRPGTPWRTVAATIAVLGTTGMLLDVCFGYTFFAFPNQGATVRIGFWGFDPASGRWIPGLPIEEAAFYYSTVAAELLLYVWLSSAFVARYSPDRTLADRGPRRWLHWPAALPGVGLVAAAVLYTEFIRPAPARFPGYLIFIVAVALIPSCLLHRATRHAINWQAVAFTTLAAALVDLVWEATLAGPYGWWAYRQDMMIGLRITAWHDLPVEAPLLWLVSPFCVVTVYTAIQLKLAAGNHHRDVQAAGRPAASGDGRAVRADDRPGDGQPEPDAVAHAGPGLHAPERFE
jgi:hypothetical protein